MNCRNCGSQLLPGSKFCTTCGAPVNSVETNQIVEPATQSNTLYKLTINRKKSFVASLVSLDVNIDNVKVGTIKNGETLVVNVTPGQHTIFLSKDSLLIKVDPNNMVNLFIEGDTTADVVIFGANNFGIANVQGAGKELKTSTNNQFAEKNNKKVNSVLIFSIVLPIISLILYYTSEHVINEWIYGLVIGFAIVNLVGIKNLKSEKNNKSALIKSIIAILISVIAVIVTIALRINY